VLKNKGKSIAENSLLNKREACAFHAIFGSHGLSKIIPQKPQILRDYRIRLTREYTDGRMDSHAGI